MALEDLQPSKAREFPAKLMMQGRESGQFSIDQPLFDVGGSSARCGWLFPSAARMCGGGRVH